MQTPFFKEIRITHAINYKTVYVETRCKFCSSVIKCNNNTIKYSNHNFRCQQILKYRRFFLQSSLAQLHTINEHSILCVSICKNISNPNQGESIMISCKECLKTLYFSPSSQLFNNNLNANMIIGYYNRIFSNPFVKICKK